LEDGQLILVAGALLTVALLASLVADRVKVPGLVLLLGLGMLVGSDGAGWIAFDDYELARTIGIIALALILFEGGLAAGFEEIRPVLRPAILLALLGTLGTAVVTGLAASWLFDLSTTEGLLVGSIVAATDGAATFALLRGSTLKRKLARTLEGESGLNDPVAVLLVIGFTEVLIEPGFGAFDFAGLLALELAVGAAVGLVIGRAGVLVLGRVTLASAGLYPVASIATAAVAFGLADVLHGSGFLAVYLAGLVLGTQNTPAKRTITTFHDGLAWVAQLVLFFTLGLLVFPSQLLDFALEGTILAVVVVFVARPLAVFVATALDRFSTADRLVLGWAGLRGAIPMVLATFPVIEGIEGSIDFFNIVFFAVLLSTLLQGTTFQPFARALGVTSNEAALPSPLAEATTIRRLGAEVVEFPVAPGDAIAGRPVRELGLPREALLNVIIRGDQAIPPRGSTVVEAGDRLHVLVRQEVAIEFRALLERWRTGPVGPPPRPPRIPRNAPAVFTSRPWTAEDGDSARPDRIAGVEVVERLRTRRDVPGALVVLADGRYAISGPVLAMGSAAAVQLDARRRLRNAKTDAERAWWREVVGAVAVG
jgi:cell volume regulation protein A